MGLSPSDHHHKHQSLPQEGQNNPCPECATPTICAPCALPASCMRGGNALVPSTPACQSVQEEKEGWHAHLPSWLRTPSRSLRCFEVLDSLCCGAKMAAETQGPESSSANGVPDHQYLPNGVTQNGDVDHQSSKAKLTPAEKKRLKKKQRKVNKQQQR